MDLSDMTNAPNSNPAASGGSPWDESLPEVEKSEPPKIVGTFGTNSGNTPESDEKPVPFNIPKDIDGQVGGKVDAASVAANDQVAKNPAVPATPDKALLDPAGNPVRGGNTGAPTTPPAQKKDIFAAFRKKTAPPPAPVQQNIPAPASAKPQASDPFAAPVPAPTQARANVPAPVAPASTAPAPGPAFAKPKGPSFFKKPGFVITFSIILLFAGLTFLTEAGILSIGLEKIYGLVGLEQLWGGLGRNPERAIPVAIANTKNHPNFKIRGSISLTVNKTIKSNVTSPLVSMANLPFAFKDENVSNKLSAALTQYEDYYSTDTTDTSTTDSSANTTTDTSDTATSTTDSAATSTPLGDQSAYPGYSETETTIKEMNFEFEGASNEKSVSTDITVKKLVGAEGNISLINSGNDLYVKTSSDIKYNEKADINKWLDYKVASLDTDENSASKLFSAKPDQNFSIIGSRISNEKIEGVRCYNYRIDKLEIGGILDGMGISSEMVQKIDGNIWLGVADHLVHRIKIVIIPSISSSVTRAEIDLIMSSFDIENDITLPSLTDVVDINSTSSETTVPETETPATTTPTVSTETARDTVRKEDLASIKSALEAYKQKTGRYPVSSAMIRLNTSGNIVEDALLPTYIDSLPADPKAADGWFFGYTGSVNNYRLSARFENLNDPEITKVGDVYLHYVYND